MFVVEALCETGGTFTGSEGLRTTFGGLPFGRLEVYLVLSDQVIKHWNHTHSIDVFPTEEPVPQSARFASEGELHSRKKVAADGGILSDCFCRWRLWGERWACHVRFVQKSETSMIHLGGKGGLLKSSHQSKHGLCDSLIHPCGSVFS